MRRPLRSLACVTVKALLCRKPDAAWISGSAANVPLRVSRIRVYFSALRIARWPGLHVARLRRRARARQAGLWALPPSGPPKPVLHARQHQTVSRRSGNREESARGGEKEFGALRRSRTDEKRQTSIDSRIAHPAPGGWASSRPKRSNSLSQLIAVEPP
jgi:hypothetical protein